MSLSTERPSSSPSHLRAIGEDTVPKWKDRHEALDEETISAVLAEHRRFMNEATITTFASALAENRLRSVEAERKLSSSILKENSNGQETPTANGRHTLFRRIRDHIK